MHRYWLDQSIIRLTLPSAEEGERSNARRQSQTISGLAALSPSAVQRPERNHNSINQKTPLIVLLVKVFRNTLHHLAIILILQQPNHLPISISNNTLKSSSTKYSCTPSTANTSSHPRHATWGARSPPAASDFR